MSPPTIDKFLGEIIRIVLAKNGVKLQQYLILEPPLPPLYNQIVGELKQVYPPSSQDALQVKCKSFIPERDEDEVGGSRLPFISFMVKYFCFLRDVNVDNLVETHDMLKALLKWVAKMSMCLYDCAHLHKSVYPCTKFIDGVSGAPYSRFTFANLGQTCHRS